MVSTSSPDRAELKRDDKRLVRKARSDSLYRHSVQSEARLAAQHAAQRVGIHENIHPSDRSVASEASAFSTERAIQRGSQRALLDSFEGDESRVGHSRSVADFDLTTVTEDVTLPTHQTNSEGTLGVVKKKSWRIVRISRKKSSLKGGMGSKRGSGKSYGSARSSNQSVLKVAPSHDAWMCGVCGKVFSTYKSAEVHEELCIREKVAACGLMIETAVPVNAKVLATPDQSNVAGSQRRQPAVADNVDVARAPPDKSDRSFQSAVSSEKSAEALNLRKSVDFADLYPEESLESTEVKGNGFRKPILRRPLSPVPFPELVPSNHNECKGQMEKVSGRLSMLSKTSPHGTTPTPASKKADDDLLLPGIMRRYVALPDEALVNAVLRAIPLTLNMYEIDAEIALRLLALDKAYYDAMARRASHRKKFRIEKSTGTGIIAKVQHKFVDAYQLIKEGETEDQKCDQYTRRNKGGGSGGGDIEHTDDTFYVNVIVKQSIHVVSNELDRLAKIRWEDTQRKSRIELEDEKTARFERFRAFTLTHAVKLAGLALASDFTPRRIAVQLSNDLYRLMAPQLKPRGVSVEAEIEYRVGPYFIIAVNVLSVSWVMFMNFSYKDSRLRRQKWAQEQSRREKLREGTAEEGKATDTEEEPSKLKRALQFIQRVRNLTLFDIITKSLTLLYQLPWIVSVPICWSMYHVFLRKTMRKYILNTVTDDIFSYVESKGMEMEIAVKHSRNQAAFMLAALRELREDSRELKKKRKETDSADKGEVLGPLLGPAIKSDKLSATPPPDFVPPENLETVGLEVDLPVGFKRLRWGLLNSKCRFVPDAVFEAEAKNKEIVFEPWSHHDDTIGLPDLPDGVKAEDFIGAERETSYLMPKSAFVSANTAFETNIITEYNDYCFCLKKKTRNPDVPFGSTFVAWTQVVVTNTGENSCRMVCSVEAEFPNGPPMAGGQIRSGMRAGTAQFFVLMGETICKYADEYP